MDDLKALRGVVLERIETLASVRLERINWEEANNLTPGELVHAAYLDGARDALAYLEMLLSREAQT
jgi:hypothetical protein